MFNSFESSWSTIYYGLLNFLLALMLKALPVEICWTWNFWRQVGYFEPKY